MTPSSAAAERAEAVARDLLSLGERERALLVEGRLEELGAVAAEREVLTRELDAVLPAGPLPPGPLRTLVERVGEQGRETLALLSSVKEEVARGAHKVREERHAATSYETARTL